MDKRLELHEMLCELLGSRNVYFQPPENVRMKYPAIVYALDNVKVAHADGGVYSFTKRYSVTFITDDPDNSYIDKMLQLTMCSFNREYVSDNLYHYVFELYY